MIALELSPDLRALWETRVNKNDSEAVGNANSGTKS